MHVAFIHIYNLHILVKHFVMEKVITNCFRLLKLKDIVKKSNTGKSADIFIVNKLILNNIRYCVCFGVNCWKRYERADLKHTYYFERPKVKCTCLCFSDAVSLQFDLRPLSLSQQSCGRGIWDYPWSVCP